MPTAPTDPPEEDKYLCVHEWCDMYDGGGLTAGDPNIALMTFYCRKCLAIRVKSYSMRRFHRNREFLEDFYRNDTDISSVG